MSPIVARVLLAAALYALAAVAPVSAQAPDGGPLTRIAFGSCADEEKPQPIWEAIPAY